MKVIIHNNINNIKCNKCGKYISQTLVRGDGLPNGVGFELEDGKAITLCAECIQDLGSRDDKGKDAFFKELGIERG